MNQSIESFFVSIRNFLLKTSLFIFPIFFLPLTPDFFLFNKLYLLALVIILLFLSSIIQLIVEKKLTWQNLPSDLPMLVFLLTVALSILINSPNKIQALLNINDGLLLFFTLAVFYFYLSRQAQLKIFSWPTLSGSLVAALLTLFFFFNPFAKLNLPPSLTFLKNQFFNPLGSFTDAIGWLAFFAIFFLFAFLKERKKTFFYLFFLVHLVALFALFYRLFQPATTATTNSPLFPLPPYDISWYAAVEILKKPLTALFGAGVDNFSAIFTQVKTVAYNQSPLWQIYSFNASRSALLHLFTEMGIFGIIGFSLIFVSLWRQIKNHLEKKILLLSLLFLLLLLPPSLITFFLFFLLAASINQKTGKEAPLYHLNLAPFPPLVYGLALLWLLVTAGFSYFLGRSYLAEYYFKKSLDGFVQNNIKIVYDNNRQAVILNPYIERFRLQFSQVNLAIANNIVQNALQKTQEKEKNNNLLNETERQNLYQAIQAAINEAKAAVSLNPQKASHWENLASIYRNIINLVQQADLWAISSYQRAIVLDPQNPFYRLNLGGIYYSLNNFDDAIRLFEQAVALKPDWPNAHYNLAWADYQKGNYKRAVSEMENVLSLLDPKKDKADYEKAKKELETFKEKLPKEEEEATPSAAPQKLNLPTPIPTISPQFSLPKEASPEAKELK